MIHHLPHSRDCDDAGCPGHPDGSYAIFARGATGRVCEVLRLCTKHAKATPGDSSSLEEINAWAESVPGGHLDW